jgi:hypothetical protein
MTNPDQAPEENWPDPVANPDAEPADIPDSKDEMTFLDHLEDLRWTIFKSFLAFALEWRDRLCPVRSGKRRDRLCPVRLRKRRDRLCPVRLRNGGTGLDEIKLSAPSVIALLSSFSEAGSWSLCVKSEVP